MSNAGRVTKVEYARRVDVVKRLLLKGAGRPAILQLAAREWGLSTRSADGLIRRAKDEIETYEPEESEKERRLTLQRLETLYLDAARKGWINAAISALREKCKLRGLYQPIAIEHRVATGLEQMPKDDVLKLYEAAHAEADDAEYVIIAVEGSEAGPAGERDQDSDRVH